jgi:hypothetical protein
VSMLRRALGSPRLVVYLEVGLCLALLALFLAYRDLPLVDLPQHALQIANWIRLSEPSPPSDLELNLRTPYLLAYPLARVLAPLVGVVVALKLVVWASIAAHVAAFDLLCRRLGHDRYLALLSLPLALGYAFLFGFVSFAAAMPLLLLSIVAALEHGLEPTPRRGALLALALSLTLVAHGVAFALACLVAGPLLLTRRRFALALSPLAVPIVLYALWILPGSSANRIGADYWDVGWVRLTELPGLLVGIGGADSIATLGGVLLLLLLLRGVGHLQNTPQRLLPLAFALAGYFLFPVLFRGVGPLGPRFSAILIPALLIATAPRLIGESNTRALLQRGSVVALVVGWCLLFSVRLASFNRETRSFHALVERLPENMSVRPLVFDRETPAFPGTPTLVHFPAYYTVAKGGTQGYSFAMYPLSVIRYREHVTPTMSGGAEWRPEDFDAQREAERYDYFLVNSSIDRTEELFGSLGDAIELDARVGSWWGYRRARDDQGVVAHSP